MALETATYINGLVATNPAASDAINTADDHLRLIKSTIKATFPNITGPVTKTQADLNVANAPLASPALTGTPTAPTAAAGTNTTQISTTAFVTTAVTNERTASATLTNKTLTSPTVNTPTISGGTITGITDLAVADGGTGASSITANSVILGNGTSALSGNLVAPGTSGNVLTSNGTTWVSQAVPVPGAAVSVAGTSTTLTLGAGTWIVSAWFRFYTDYMPAASLVIDGTTVDTLPNRGDPSGTTHSMLWGFKELTGNRTISISGSPTGMGSYRLMVIANRIG